MWTHALGISALLLVLADCTRACEVSSQLQCSNGTCLDASLKCDGQNDCDDGSDEKLCRVPSTNLRVNDQVDVIVQHVKENRGLRFLLCDASDCNMITVLGVDVDATLSYYAYAGCKQWGLPCLREEGENFPPNAEELPTRQVTFRASLTATTLSLWLRGHPERAVSVPSTSLTGKILTQLRVRPLVWSSDPVVTFRKVLPGCTRKFSCLAVFEPVCATYEGRLRTFGNDCQLRSYICRTGQIWLKISDSVCPYGDPANPSALKKN